MRCSRSAISSARFKTASALSFGIATTPSSLATMMSPGAIVTPAHLTGIWLATLAKRVTALAGEIERA